MARQFGVSKTTKKEGRFLESKNLTNPRKTKQPKQGETQRKGGKRGKREGKVTRINKKSHS